MEIAREFFGEGSGCWWHNPSPKFASLAFANFDSPSRGGCGSIRKELRRVSLPLAEEQHADDADHQRHGKGVRREAVDQPLRHRRMMKAHPHPGTPQRAIAHARFVHVAAIVERGIDGESWQ